MTVVHAYRWICSKFKTVSYRVWWMKVCKAKTFYEWFDVHKLIIESDAWVRVIAFRVFGYNSLEWDAFFEEQSILSGLKSTHFKTGGFVRQQRLCKSFMLVKALFYFANKCINFNASTVFINCVECIQKVFIDTECFSYQLIPFAINSYLDFIQFNAIWKLTRSFILPLIVLIIMNAFSL